jgi:hypothetical protein
VHLPLRPVRRDLTIPRPGHEVRIFVSLIEWADLVISE